jgi:hypothetical protein
MSCPLDAAVAIDHAARLKIRQMLTGSAVNAAIYKFHSL